MPTVKAAGNTSEKAVENAAEKPKSRKRDILETVLYLAVVVGICLLFIRFVAYRCVVEGSSMEHYLEDKDNLIAERITYYFRKPERFEVIIFKREGESRHGQEKGDSLIKRIIGLPGETVSISNGKVSINGKVLEEDHYAMAGYTSAMEPVTLGEDEYFVLGDNRDISLDSRYIGPVKFSAFEGRAWIRIWPMNKIMVIRPDN
ncbi:MAG: signal peptidase I [Lachnospiraceae bacterium]|nr:signal peptidase I [Lachnospiraceae bacterium]